MSHICNYCGNETAGADPCPWCNGSLGVVPEKPKIEPVVIHDDARSFNGWPIAGVVLLLLVIGVVLMQRKHNQDQIVAATHDSPSYVVSNQPLFQNSIAVTPKLARTTAIKSSGLPEMPSKVATPKVKEKVEDTPDDQVDPKQDLAPIVDSRPESVQLTDVQMASQNDGDGHEMAIGSATIYNPSPYEITNFDLYIASAGGTYRLDPFSGAADNPIPLASKTIPPGGRVTFPVMSNGVYNAGDSTASKTVSVEAVENGVTVSSHVTIN